MKQNIIIVDFSKVHRYFDSIKSVENDILILNEILSEIAGTPYTTDFFGISYCFSGTCTLKNELETYTIQAGKLFISRPGEICQVEAVDGFKAVHIAFHRDFILRNFVLCHNKITAHPFFRGNSPNLIDLKKSEQKKMIWYINKITAQKGEKGIFANHILESVLTAFIYEISNIISLNAVDEEEKLSGRNEIFDRFEVLLDEHHTVAKTVKFYANKLNISPAYLNEIVKRKTTKSVLTVIHEFILFKAKVFLARTDYNISEIAAVFNFPDATTFIKFFKKKTSVSPLKYRNSIERW